MSFPAFYAFQAIATMLPASPGSIARHSGTARVISGRALSGDELGKRSVRFEAEPNRDAVFWEGLFASDFLIEEHVAYPWRALSKRAIEFSGQGGYMTHFLTGWRYSEESP